MRAVVARGTATILRSDALHLSPALGLAAQASPLALNLHRCASAGDAQPSALALRWRARCFRAATAASAARDAHARSQAAAHLTPAALGHVLGLGLRGAGAAEITATPRDACGIRTNRVADEWTGVSGSRYRRLVELVHASADASAGAHLPSLLVLRVLWERATCKRGLLDFFLAVDCHVPTLADGAAALREDGNARREWVDSVFAPADLTDAKLARAAEVALTADSGAVAIGARPRMDLASSIEVLCAGLSQVHAFKQGIRVARHGWHGGAEKPIASR